MTEELTWSRAAFRVGGTPGYLDEYLGYFDETAPGAMPPWVRLAKIFSADGKSWGLQVFKNGAVIHDIESKEVAKSLAELAVAGDEDGR